MESQKGDETAKQRLDQYNQELTALQWGCAGMVALILLVGVVKAVMA